MIKIKANGPENRLQKLIKKAICKLFMVLKKRSVIKIIVR